RAWCSGSKATLIAWAYCNNSALFLHQARPVRDLCRIGTSCPNRLSFFCQLLLSLSVSYTHPSKQGSNTQKGVNEMADREPLSNLQPVFSCGLVMVSSEMRLSAALPNLQKRCTTIRFSSGFLRL